MRHRRFLQVASSGLVVLAVALDSGAASKDIESRREHRNPRVAAKLASLERLGKSDVSSRAAARRSAAAPVVSASGSETVAVDCTRGRSISDAIAKSKARYLRVVVSGTCAESVVVERPGVTISGAAAGGATIEAAHEPLGPPTGAAIRALGAHELALEDLTLTGGLNGLDATDSRRMSLTRIKANDNPGVGVLFLDGYGVRLDASEATISDSEFSRNGYASHVFEPSGGPILVVNGSRAEIAGCTMDQNRSDGPFSLYNSVLFLSGCTMTMNGLGPQAIGHSRTHVRSSTLDGSEDDFAVQDSELTYTDSTITGMNRSFAGGDSILRYTRSSVQTGGLTAFTSSTLEFLGSTLVWEPCVGCEEDEQPAVPFLFVSSHSFADVRRSGAVESNVAALVFLDKFSDGSFETAAPIGRVQCSKRSRVITNLPPLGGTSGCE